MVREPKWMRAVLLCAAAYNLLWGALVIAYPLAIFKWAGIPAPNYPEIWQCVGMIVGVYGVAYACAAMAPLRFWPVTLAGLLGKVLGPIGFVQAALNGRLPWKFGVVNITNDLIWWVPFALILHAAWQHFKTEPDRIHSPAWQRAQTECGEALGEISFRSPVLLVALRHSGCTFCREALADLARVRPSIEGQGTRIVLAHMGTPAEGRDMAGRYGLHDVDRIADPNRLLYHSLGLTRGSLGQLFGPVVLWRGFTAGVLNRHGIGMLKGDGFQMGGVFLLDRGRIAREFRYHHASDRPDFMTLGQDSVRTSN